MGWTRKKENRLEFLYRAAIPLSQEDVEKVKRLAAIEGEVARLKTQEWETPQDLINALLALNDETGALLASLPEHWEDRLEFTGDPSHLERALLERQALQYEQDCEFASEEKKKILSDPVFLSACEKAGVAPSRRQASKWLRRRRGAANRAAGRIL